MKMNLALSGRAISPMGMPVVLCTGRRACNLKVSALRIADPYSVLGVEPGVDTKQVKRAYRKLAKQFHPDVSQEEQAEARFVAITEAYECLVNVLSGRGLSGAHQNTKGNSQAFHDWYWSFRMGRTWNSNKNGRPSPTSSAAPQPLAGLHSQLSGLRQRAAVRRATTSKPPATATSSTAGTSSSQHGAAAPSPPGTDGSTEHTGHSQADRFVVADGTSDSADASVRAGAAPPQGFNSNRATGAGRSSQEPMPGSQHSDSTAQVRGRVRGGFVGGTQDRTAALRDQLAGMRRKAALKAQQQQAQQ